MAVKDVVAEHECGFRAADEGLADEKGLRESTGGRLYGVTEVRAPLTAVAEKLTEARGILRGRNDQNVAHACQHERAERVVDHRLVVDWQELFRNRERGGVKARSRAARENDPFAVHMAPCEHSSSMRRET